MHLLLEIMGGIAFVVIVLAVIGCVAFEHETSGGWNPFM